MGQRQDAAGAADGRGSPVAGIISALSALEADIDSLDAGIDGMKRRLAARAQSEIDSLFASTREMASREAGQIVSRAKAEAEAEAARIAEAGQARTEELRARIDAGMDRAVEHVVSSVLRA